LFWHPTSSPTWMLSSHHTHPFRISRTTLSSHIRPKTSLVSLTLIIQTLSFHQGTSFLLISKRTKITAFYTRYAGLRLRKRSGHKGSSRCRRRRWCLQRSWFSFTVQKGKAGAEKKTRGTR
jgi:hypothetical protein